MYSVPFFFFLPSASFFHLQLTIARSPSVGNLWPGQAKLSHGEGAPHTWEDATEWDQQRPSGISMDPACPGRQRTLNHRAWGQATQNDEPQGVVESRGRVETAADRKSSIPLHPQTNQDIRTRGIFSLRQEGPERPTGLLPENGPWMVIPPGAWGPLL